MLLAKCQTCLSATKGFTPDALLGADGVQTFNYQLSTVHQIRQRSYTPRLPNPTCATGTPRRKHAPGHHRQQCRCCTACTRTLLQRHHGQRCRIGSALAAPAAPPPRQAPHTAAAAVAGASHRLQLLRHARRRRVVDGQRPQLVRVEDGGAGLRARLRQEVDSITTAIELTLIYS